MSAANLKAAATGNITPAEARDPYSILKKQLEAAKAELMPLLGNSANNVDRFTRVVLNAAMLNPDLIDADRRSLIAACARAAQDGLLPDGREAVLNIYSTKVKQGNAETWIKKVQYLPMVGGLVKKLYEGGEVTYIDAACVYENDRFTFRRGEDPLLQHEPTMDADPGNIVAAYCVVKLKSGEIKREVMARRDIDKVRAASKSANNGPWATWFDQMAIKSVIKRAYKTLPRSDAFDVVEARDNEVEMAAAGSLVPPPVAALANEPSEVIDIKVAARDTVEAKNDAGQPEREPLKVAEPWTYAQFAEAIQKSDDRSIAGLLLDESQDVLDAAAHADLKKVYDRKFPPVRS